MILNLVGVFMILFNIYKIKFIVKKIENYKIILLCFYIDYDEFLFILKFWNIFYNCIYRRLINVIFVWILLNVIDVC